MKLFKLSQDSATGYDTYDSCVVAAKNEETAKTISPDTFNSFGEKSSWADSPDDVLCECLGTATKGTKQGVILASFNAG